MSDDLTYEQRERLRAARDAYRARADERKPPRMVAVPNGPYDEIYEQGVSALNADAGDVYAIVAEPTGNPGELPDDNIDERWCELLSAARDLDAIIARTGGWMSAEDQVVLRRARDVIARRGGGR